MNRFALGYHFVMMGIGAVIEKLHCVHCSFKRAAMSNAFRKIVAAYERTVLS